MRFVEHATLDLQRFVSLRLQDLVDEPQVFGITGVRSRDQHDAARLVCTQHAGFETGGSDAARIRSEEHTSELQSLMRISYAVLCLKKNTDRPSLSWAATPYDYTTPTPTEQSSQHGAPAN